MSLPLRVLAFTTLFPNPSRPHHGLFVKRRLEHLGELCDLRVVAPVNVVQNPGALARVPRRLRLDGLDVRHPRFVVVPALLKHRDGDMLYRQSRAAAREAAAAGVDVLDAHYAFPDGHAARRIAQDLGKPYVLSLRGSDIHLLPKFPRRRERIVQCLADAAAVVAVSEELAAAAISLGTDARKVLVIPNGVDTGLFAPGDRSAARERLGLPRDGRLVLSVGRLVPLKGFDVLLRAVRRVRDRRDETVRCVVLGEGPSRGELHRLAGELGIDDVVSLPGWVEAPRLADWYAAADVFALLSDNEGCPNVVVEALASGTPVVGHAVGGIPEMVRDGVNGLLVGERTGEAAAAQIERALGMPWDREAIRRSDAVRTWDGVAERQLEALREAARAR